MTVTTAPTIGVVFPPDEPPERLLPVARAADGAGLPQLWLWEDCFKESGVAAASAALAATDRLALGLGLLPAPLRNVALTAMEIATISRMFPDRILAGIGHGVAEWMAQSGVLAESPMTLLREYAVALRSVLSGASTSVSGRYVNLDEVRLDWPPQVVPPLLIGAVGPRTTRLAGELADGLILTGETTLEQLRDGVGLQAQGRAAAGREGTGATVVFVPVVGAPSARAVADQIGLYLDAGATHPVLLSVGAGRPPLEEFVQFIGQEAAPLLAG